VTYLVLPLHPVLLAGRRAFSRRSAALALLAASAPGAGAPLPRAAAPVRRPRARRLGRRRRRGLRPRPIPWATTGAAPSRCSSPTSRRSTPTVRPRRCPRVGCGRPVTGEVLTVRHDGGAGHAVARSASRPARSRTGRPAQPAGRGDAFRDATNLLPFPVWIRDPTERSTGRTPPILGRMSTRRRSDTWPPPPLFDPALLPPATPEGASPRPARHRAPPLVRGPRPRGGRPHALRRRQRRRGRAGRTQPEGLHADAHEDLRASDDRARHLRPEAAAHPLQPRARRHDGPEPTSSPRGPRSWASSTGCGNAASSPSPRTTRAGGARWPNSRPPPSTAPTGRPGRCPPARPTASPAAPSRRRGDLPVRGHLGRDLAHPPLPGRARDGAGGDRQPRGGGGGLHLGGRSP
jgi:hypothetical protein